ncbi:MAG TPA: glutaredoxin family protein [Thiobacillus sp.]
MKTGLFVALTCVAMASTPLLAGQLYQWKDAQGHTVYSDQPPPPSVRNAQQKNFKGNLIETGDSYATQTAREKFPLTLYASACGAPCDQARKLLNDRGAPFSSKDPQASPDAQAELKKITGRLNVPVLVIGSDKIDGFESDQWHAALDRAGYPKSVVTGRKTTTEPAAPPSVPAAAPQPAPATK